MISLCSCVLSDTCSSPDLLQVELKMRKTCFWRRQKGKPDTYLATIEAIYYFLKDFHEHCLDEGYNGEYDNLLFFYSYLHSVVNKAKTSAGKCWEWLWGKRDRTVAEELIEMRDPYALVQRHAHHDVVIISTNDRLCFGPELATCPGSQRLLCRK